MGDNCMDCKKRRGIRRGLGVLFLICDPCWMRRILNGPPRCEARR